jgi:hypothetical protein
MLLALPVVVVVFLLAGPTWAQDDGTEGIPVGIRAAGQDTDNTNSPPDLIVVSANDCTVDADDSAVSITIEDSSETRARFVDGQKAVTITAPNGRPQIQGPAADFIGDHAVSKSDPGFDTDGDYTVASSEGVTCARTGGRQRAGDDAARAADDDLRNLSCDELLVQFRSDSGSGQQYGDAAALTDPEVRARIEVCLKKEIVNNPGGNLPNTGGLSLIGLAVLGAVSAVAGLAVIRGGRR